jgi:hypothetical protein
VLTMPWRELYELNPVPPQGREALRLLDLKVGEALKQIGHETGFAFGRLLGTPIETLYGALGVELACSHVWLHGRPRLELIAPGEFRYNAPPTRAVGRSHRDYQLASDLLRALAWHALRQIVLDNERLNSICRNFSDAWLFDHPAQFASKLAQYETIFGIHEQWSIPISALSAYIAKLSQHDASVDTLFVFEGPHVEGPHVRHLHRLGIRQPSWDRLMTITKLFRDFGAPAAGGRSLQYAATDVNGRMTLANASAGLTILPEQQDVFNATRVIRVVFTSIRRLPSSIHGPLH